MFLRDLAGLKVKAGGCGFRNTQRRAVFLNAMNNTMPQMIGDGVTPGLWPDLAPTLGANSFRKGNEKERWKFFFESGSAWATELELEIRRVKDLRNKATRAAGLADPPRHSVFDEPEEGFGAGADKLHRLIFDDIRGHEARALAARARTLMPSDQRRLAFQQSSSCKFSNTLFSGAPNKHTRLSNSEFQAAVQNVLGAPQSILAHAVGLPIFKSPSSGEVLANVDSHGNNLKKLKGATGGGTSQLHNSLVNHLSYWLQRAKIPHKGGAQGKPKTCKDLFTHASSRCRRRAGGMEDTETLLKSIIPDLMIDGRFLSSTLSGDGACLFRGRKSIADVKTKSCDESYGQERTGIGCARVNIRQREVNDKYHARAKELDQRQGTPSGTAGPFENGLKEYGLNGQVIGPVMGAFAEMSSDVYSMVDLISSVLAEEHCSYFAEEPSDAKGYFKARLYRSFGLLAHKGWARLMIDRYQDTVRAPRNDHERSGARQGNDAEEEALEHENYFNPNYQHHQH